MERLLPNSPLLLSFPHPLLHPFTLHSSLHNEEQRMGETERLLSSLLFLSSSPPSFFCSFAVLAPVVLVRLAVGFVQSLPGASGASMGDPVMRGGPVGWSPWIGVLMWGPSPVRGGRRRAVTIWDSSGVSESKWRWWAHAAPVPGSPGGAWVRVAVRMWVAVRVGVAVGMWVAEALLVGGRLMLALVLAVTLIEWANLALQTIPGRGTAPTPVAGGPG